MTRRWIVGGGWALREAVMEAIMASKGLVLGEVEMGMWLILASVGIESRLVRSKVWQKGVSGGASGDGVGCERSGRAALTVSA